VGAPVDFQGLRVKSVADLGMQHLGDREALRIPVFIELERDRIRRRSICFMKITLHKGGNMSTILRSFKTSQWQAGRMICSEVWQTRY
jgi:hypothetical protein